MMKGITVRLFRLAALGKLAIVILSLLGFVSVVNAYNAKDTSTPPSQTQSAPKPVEKPDTAPKEETISEAIPYSTVTIDNPKLEKGKTRVKVQGVNGVMTSTYYIAYENGVEVSRLHVSSEVTTEPVNEVVEVGTFAASAPAITPDDDRGPIHGPEEPEPEPEPDDEPIILPPYCEDVAHRDRTERRMCELD